MRSPVLVRTHFKTCLDDCESFVCSSVTQIRTLTETSDAAGRAATLLCLRILYIFVIDIFVYTGSVYKQDLRCALPARS